MKEIDIHISLSKPPPLNELGIIWQSLQARSDHSFFTSWAWIGCWLDTLPKSLKPLLLKGESAGRTIGLGIIFAKTRHQLKLFETPAFYLNTTGDPYFDEITIEYNGFLVDRAAAPEIAKELLSFLFTNHEHRCNEVFIDGGSDTQSMQRIAPAGTRLQIPRIRSCYSVDLDALRASGQEYIATLSSSRRYNIRRSIRKYAELGQLNTRVADSVTEALFFLDKLSQLHQAYWRKKGTTGAFTNPFFYDFIQRIISTQFASGCVQLMRICTGDRAIGYLLNFVYQGHVYQYQSGFDYDICKKYNSPGYVCHLQAVEHNLKSGHHMYDYMAGDSDYKKVMGKRLGELSWQVIQRDTLGFRIENRIRHVVRKLRSVPESRKFFGGKSA